MPHEASSTDYADWYLASGGLRTCEGQHTDATPQGPYGQDPADLPRPTAVSHFLHFSASKVAMNITLTLVPVVSLVAGILILAVPRLLSTIVAVYLIMVGLVGIFGAGQIFR